MQAVKIECSNADARPVFVLEDVERTRPLENESSGECGSADVCVESGEGVQCVSEQALPDAEVAAAEKKEI
jgi:hypothetical protein